IDSTSLRLGGLISGTGSNLQALIDAIESKNLANVEIALVVSNKADAYGLQRALTHNLPVVYLPWKERAESEARLAALLRLFRVDLVVLVGWMRILSASFIEQFSQHIINLHPALIPDDGTGYTYTTRAGTQIPVFRGLQVVKQALDAGIKTTRSTVHYVTPEADAGPVIGREEDTRQEADTEEPRRERLTPVEHRL